MTKFFVNGHPIDGVTSVEIAHLNPVRVEPIPFANAVKFAVPQAKDINVGYVSFCDNSGEIRFVATRDQAKSLADRLWDAGLKPAKADEAAGVVKELECRVASLEARNKDLVAKIDANYVAMNKLREVVEVLMP